MAVGNTNASAPGNAEAITKIDRDLGYSVGDSQTVKSDLAEIKAAVSSIGSVVEVTTGYFASVSFNYTILLGGISAKGNERYAVKSNDIISCSIGERSSSSSTSYSPSIKFNGEEVATGFESSFYFIPGNVSSVNITAQTSGGPSSYRFDINITTS